MSVAASLLPERSRSAAVRPVSAWLRRYAGPVRAGQIGPIRREIIFEPLPDEPAPAEAPPAAPEQPQEQPVPAQT